MKGYWDKMIPVSPKVIIDKIPDLEIFDGPEIKYLNIRDRVEYDSLREKYVIYVSPCDAFHYRLKLARLLAAYSLNLARGKPYYLDEKSNEVEGFIEELLMPISVIDWLIETDVHNISQMAYKLWVSDTAMYERLRKIGYVK